ncbi:MAG: penicillin-insensitive murein endopeptidase, partial [Myxococcota bacterium]
GLKCGRAMPIKGKHHRFSWTAKKKGSNYGTPDMIRLLERSANTVGSAVDGPPLVLGSISVRHGGKLGRHKSHQGGRDVDILFYAVSPDGKRKRSVGFYDFDGAGRCTAKRCKGWTFDVQRNWWLVRTMVWSKRPEIQYIFVSKPLEKLMLNYARKRKEHPEILRRAAKVMAEPGNSSPHADHFHVRIYCSKKDKAAGCRDSGPRWDWVAGGKKKRKQANAK